MNRALAGGLACVLAAASPALAETPLERGAYLANGIVACGNCHTPQTPTGPDTSRELAGQFLLEDQGIKAYAPNITPHRQDGVGAWSDDELVRAIRDGVRPDGTVIGPPMPFAMYRQMSDGDTRAIVAYLRSVVPAEGRQPKSEYAFPLPPAWGPPAGSVAEPDRTDRVGYGRYLATIGHCFECHSPAVNGLPDIEHQMGAGGFAIPGPWGVAVSANITPHPEDGIGTWSDDDVKRAITQGVKPDGTAMMPPRGYGYSARMTPEDLDALVAYLRTIPAKPSPK